MLTLLPMLAVILAQPDPVVLARPPAVSPAEFQAWFDKARAGQLTIPKEVERSARRYRYVFVAGFQNERMPGYFGQNARELRARGVPKRLIHFVTPDSNETVAGNAETVRSQLHEIAGKGPEEVVIIAHSRGACDALAFALENQDFLSDRVRAMFLLQGPFGGTGVADYLVGDGPALDGRMPWGTRVIVKALAALEGYALKQGKHGGLPAMATQSSEEFWEQLLREHTAAIPVVGPKTFYVTAQIAPRQLRLFKRAIAWYLESYFGPNDGMVALADQSVPGVGTVLAVLDAGHTDLTNQFPSAKPKRRMRKGLMDAIVMTVGDAGAVEVAKGE